MSHGPSRVRATAPRLAAAAAATLLLVPVAAVAGTNGPGAPGIGDPYFPDYGNGGYKVSHYDVEVEVAGSTVSGTTTLTAQAKQALTRFNLDFVLDTTAVKVNGEAATFSKPSTHELVVTPRTPLEKGDAMTVEVTYSDQPGSVVDRGKNPVYSTQPSGLLILGEPESAPWWIPGNDHPRDKATYDVAITVPSGVEAVTSGRLVRTVEGPSKDTWHWRVAQPTTGYLMFLAAGQYDVTRETVDGRPSVTAIGTGTGAAGEAAKDDFARMTQIIQFLQSQFGQYRFNVHGNVVPNVTVGFALETQTRPVYSPGFWFGGSSNESVVVHEHAHQWWGDNVSVHSWRDIWLNEGFATWSQWRWEEAEGDATANQIFRAVYDSHSASDPWWDLQIGDPGPNALFAGQVYDRGAMTVQGLRNRIGEDDVRTVFKRWNRQHEYDDASIAKFIRLAERVSDQDLGTFFDAWLYSSDKPPATAEFGVPKLEPATPGSAAAVERVQRTTQQLAESGHGSAAH